MTGSPPARTTAFISHHSSQYEAAKTVKAALARAGIEGWLAPDDIEPGTHFDVAIVEQLERSDVIILLLDARADRSKHVKRELMLADEGDKPIFPVRLEPVESSGLAYWLKEHQWIDWFGAEGDGLDRLVAAIERRTGSSGRAAPWRTLPPPPPAAPPSRADADAPRSSSNKGLLLGAFAIVALGLVGIVGFAGSRNGDEPERGDASSVSSPVSDERASVSAARDEAPASEPDTLIEPGTWTLTRDVVDISFPELGDELEKQISLTIETDPDPEDCVSEATARKPDVKLFDPTGENECSLSDFRMAGGKLSGFANCTLPDSGGQGKATFAFRGTYDRRLIEIENDVTMIQSGSLMKFKTRDKSRWVKRECAPA